jgi:hypothetical protein
MGLRCRTARTPGVEALEERFLLSGAALASGPTAGMLPATFLAASPSRSETLPLLGVFGSRSDAVAPGHLSSLDLALLEARQVHRETEHALHSIGQAVLLGIVPSWLSSPHGQAAHGTAPRDDVQPASQTSPGAHAPPAPEGHHAGDSPVLRRSPSSPEGSDRKMSTDQAVPFLPGQAQAALATDRPQPESSTAGDDVTQATDLEPEAASSWAGLLPVDLKPLLSCADAFFEQLARLCGPRENDSLLALAPWFVLGSVVACELALLPSVLRRTGPSNLRDDPLFLEDQA